MSFLALFALSIGLAMDTFAVGICKGLSMQKATLKNAAIIGMYFGVFQAGMPLAGYFAANQFAEMITAYTHWIAFVLLCFLGIKMIIGGLKKDPNAAPCTDPNEKSPLGPKKMLPLAVATSIDALAVGVSFAFLSVSIIPAVLLIGATTFVISAAGVKIGNIFGMKFKSKAEIAGGIILILIGINILLENTIGRGV